MNMNPWPGLPSPDLPPIVEWFLRHGGWLITAVLLIVWIVRACR